RVGDGVHRDAAHARTLAEPALASRLAEHLVLVVEVADLADGRAAAHVDLAPLARRQHERRVLALAREQLDLRAGGAAELAALPRPHLDVVDEQSQRNVRERHHVADDRLDALARLERLADLQAERREDVALLAVPVLEQRDAGAAPGVVLDGGDRRRDAVLLALEVEDAEVAPRAAAAMARGDAAGVVPPAALAMGD